MRLINHVFLGLCFAYGSGRALADAPPGRYSIASKTVRDNQTELMWHREFTNFASFTDASNFCSSSTVGGYDDWRAPTLQELFSIIDDSRAHPAIDTSAFPGVAKDYELGFFSSTVSPYHQQGSSVTRWIVFFNTGEVGDTIGAGNARCVRSD